MKRNREQVRKLQVVVEAQPVPSLKPQPSEDQFSDMEEDIFSDIEDYKPPVKSTTAAPIVTGTENSTKSYFKVFFSYFFFLLGIFLTLSQRQKLNQWILKRMLI